MKKFLVSVAYLCVFTYAVYPLELWRYLLAFGVLLFVDVYQYQTGMKEGKDIWMPFIGEHHE